MSAWCFFSWYEYSPLRVKFPYVRGKLWKLWKAALSEYGDPVVAWASIVEDEQKAEIYKSARGKGGHVRVNWRDVTQLIAAQIIYTVKKYGPDRIAGFTPIPAMSMISYASGARFISLLGGEMLSFMIGMLTYHLLHHKYGVNKRMCLNQVIGITPVILLCGDRMYH